MAKSHWRTACPHTPLLWLFAVLAAAIGCLSLASPGLATWLYRWTTFELEASKGSNMLQGTFEVGEFSKRWHAQTQFKAFPGLWRAGLSKETGQPITQHGELQIKEGVASVRLQLTKNAGSLINMVLKSTVETSNEYSFGGALGPRFQPVIIAGNVGTREGDTQLNAGFVTDGTQYKLQAAIEGKTDTSKYKLSVQSGTRQRPIIWKASVTTDTPIDLQKPHHPMFGVGLSAPKKTQLGQRQPYNTYTYMGEEGDTGGN
eukprot:GGOE01043410.1.p1 GENE.GGOE01043410.1~~GGOE01043410.1.p1  ORF type:complete len:300 (-),score=75.11 GGOE01043410.1:260-1036(-)